MCLITRQREPYIAETDITVYKILRLNEFENTFHSAYYNLYDSNGYGMLYELGKLYETTIKKEYDGQPFDQRAKINARNIPYQDRISYGQGFHSAIKENRLDAEQSPYYKKFECTIPKGAEYFLDETDLCVSNKIIISKQIN